MGPISSKIFGNSEDKVDEAVKQIDNLYKSSTEKAKDIIEAMKAIETHLKTLKSEKDFLKSKVENEKIIITNKDKDEKTRSGASKRSGCNIQLDDKQEGDKYYPIGTDRQTELKSRNDTLTERILTLEDQLKEVNCAKERYEQDIQELNDKLDEKEENHKKLNDTIEKYEKNCKNVEKDKCKTDERLNKQTELLRQLQNQYDGKQKTIEDLNSELENSKLQYEQKIREKEEMDKLIEQERNELSKMKMTIETWEKEKETIEKNITEEKKEKNVLQTKFIELQGKHKFSTDQIASLQKENERLKMENNILMTKAKEKKHISFHSVLKQPQSDQAVNGIFDLLRGQYSDIDLEMVEVSKRKLNIPLLVVLYNLSRIADDVKGALHGIEANSDVALVVLHSKEIKKPSEKILTEPEFKKLGIIVDINFVTAKGIISDDVTDKAIHQLVGFINKF